jgi:hypothetical protein
VINLLISVGVWEAVLVIRCAEYIHRKVLCVIR